MGRINDRNFQLKLAFQDQDIRKPKHDQIMHWLTAWVREPTSQERLFKSWRTRIESQSVALDAESQTRVDASDQTDEILRQLKQKHESEQIYREVQTSWSDEPQTSSRFLRSFWELPLHARDSGYRESVLGFCDLMAEYETSSTLIRSTTQFKKLRSIHPDPETSKKYRANWLFDRASSSYTYDVRREHRHVYFEVKTEISSVGELMRQLQLYRTSREVSTAEMASEHGLIVVAPPNNEAASVLRDHGIGFLEYRY